MKKKIIKIKYMTKIKKKEVYFSKSKIFQTRM